MTDPNVPPPAAQPTPPPAAHPTPPPAAPYPTAAPGQPAAGGPTPPPPGAPAPTAAPKKTLAILALVFGGLAVILGFAAPGGAWAPAIAAIVIGIIAMVKKTPPRWMPPVGLGLAVVGWIIGIVMAIVGIGNAVSTGLKSALPEATDVASAAAEPSTPAADSSAASDDSSKAPEPAKTKESSDVATIGQTVTNNKKVSFTVSSVQCGLATAGPQYLEQTAKGQFCEVKYTIQNGSSDKIDLFASDLTGHIGTATYDTESSITTFDGDLITTSVNPGLSSNVDAFIDIPAGAKLDTVVFKPQWGFLTTAITVKVS